MKLFSLLLLFAACHTIAQVGINTTAAYTFIPGTNPNFAGATANAWTSYTYSPNIVASVPNNRYLYLYFNLQNPQAYQAGKEVGIDNMSITGTNF